MNAGSGGSADGLDGEGRDAGLLRHGPVLLFDDTTRTTIALDQGFGGNAAIGALRAVLVGYVEENDFRPGARARFLGHEALRFCVRAIPIARRGALSEAPLHLRSATILGTRSASFSRRR